jgi:hypothetical protein
MYCIKLSTDLLFQYSEFVFYHGLLRRTGAVGDVCNGWSRHLAQRVVVVVSRGLSSSTWSVPWHHDRVAGNIECPTTAQATMSDAPAGTGCRNAGQDQCTSSLGRDPCGAMESCADAYKPWWASPNPSSHPLLISLIWRLCRVCWFIIHIAVLACLSLICL